MKREKLGFLSAFLLLLFLCSCETGGRVYCRSFINSYIVSDQRIDVYHISDNCILFTIKGSRVDIFSTGDDQALYDRICKENNDMTYNGYTTLIIDGFPLNVSYYPNFASINIVSDMDFDAEHPAGTSLNDLLFVNYSSYYDYIASNYTLNYPDGRKGYIKMINDIETNDLKLLASRGNNLSFTKYPDVLNKHTLTITFTDVNGNSISCSFVYDFAKYKFVDYSELEEYYKID